MADWFDQNQDPSVAVTAAYQQYLGRAPSASELQSNISNQNGLQAVIAGIQNSAEAQAYSQSQVTNAYQQYLGRAPSATELQSNVSNPNGMAAVLAGIQNSAEAKSYAASGAGAAGATGAGVQTANGMLSAADKATIDGLLQNAQSNDDPNYWYAVAAKQGGVAQTGLDWLTGRINQGDGALAVRNGTVKPFQDTPGAAGATPPGAGQAPTATVTPTTGSSASTTATQIAPFVPPPAPTYTPYNPGPAPTPTPYTPPTEAEAQATPGYQFAVDQGMTGLQRSAAAQGGLLSGGALKDISAYNVGMADQNYNNLVAQGLAINQANNTSALNAYSAGAGANISAGNLNLAGANSQFQNTYTPSWNAYLSQVGQGQFSDTYGLQAQNQFWGQGLSENQNAFNQYNTNQTTAFNQWLQTANLGNPGNPYA